MNIWQRLVLGVGALWFWVLAYVVYQNPEEKLNAILGTACAIICAFLVLKKKD